VKRISEPVTPAPGQVGTLLHSASRELFWVLPAVSREIHIWRARAELIPDQPLREDALNALLQKRDHIEGAALFSILPRDRNRWLLRLFVAYQTIFDYLDTASEGHTDAASCRQLHLALLEALDPDAPMSDYYRHHPWKDDGGYLRELVHACRTSCAALPSYSRVRPRVLALVARSAVQHINHCQVPEQRDRLLKAWAERESPDEHTFTWFELGAAASGFVPYSLLALAAEPSYDERELIDVLTVYFPSVSLLLTMLDSYADQLDDAASDDHSYITHYRDIDTAVGRLSELVNQTIREARGLHNADRHVTIISCMIAMYVSRAPAYSHRMRDRSRTLVNAGDPVTPLLLPLIRIWRRAYANRVVTNAPRPPWRTARAMLPPGPRLPRAAQAAVLYKWPFIQFEWYRRRYGNRFGIRVTGYPPFVFLADVGAIKEMLLAPADVLHPGEGAVTIEPIVGKSSFMLQDEVEHLSGRRLILPSFTASAVQEYTELVSDTTREHVAAWPRDVPVALHPRLRALTLETALRILFDTSACSIDHRLGEMQARLLEMLSVTSHAMFPEPVLRLGPGRVVWRRFLRQRAELDQLIFDIIKDRQHSDETTTSTLSKLLDARNLDGSRMSPQQVRDNLMSLILAGHETTASQLAWAFQLIAHSPSVLDKLTSELDADAGEKYLEATIQEVQRHRPVFLFTIPRAVKQPVEIGGWTYRPPIQLLGSIYLLHHDPTLYPNPQEFCPERFLETPPLPHQWLPWGGGRRRCPGLHLATLEMKTVLRSVLTTMTVRPAAKRIEHPSWRSVIATPHAGSRVVLHQRR
jgi:tetraprenyl-beta-curcumene synthase